MPLPCLDVVPVQFAFIAVTAISTTEVDDDKVVAGTKKLRVLESKPSDSGAQEQRAKKARK